MKIQSCIAWAIALAAIVVGNLSTQAATLSTGFSYQGRLFDGGTAANGQYEMEFLLRDRAMGGNQVGTTVAVAPVTVTNGLFQVTVDFGTNVWDGSARWLDVSVRTNGSISPHTLLTPSQLIQPVPYAIHSIKAGELVGTLPSTQLSGSYPNSVTMNNAANTFGGNGSGLTSLNASQLAAGTVPDARIVDTVTRDSELLSVSNALSGQLTANNSSVLGTITTTSNGLSSRLDGTNAALVALIQNGDSSLSSQILLNSNLSATGVGSVGSALGAFTNQLQTGDNIFAGSNHFSGIVTLLNFSNVISGNGSGLIALNASALQTGTVPDARLSSAIARSSGLIVVSNNVNAVQANEQMSNAFLGQLILSTESDLRAALTATNTALMSKIGTSSNALQTAIDNEATARTSLATKLQTGDNSFAGSNHFSGITQLTNAANVVAGDGAGLTGLNGSRITSGTIADARIDGTIARDSEMLSVSNSLSSQLSANNSALINSLVTTSNGLDARLVATNSALIGFLDATNTALMSKITTSSNGLQTAINNEAAARASFTTMLQSGENAFSGSNHFSGITVLTNTANVIAGNGAALMSLNADNIASGTVSRSRLPSDLVYDEPEGGITLSGSVTAPSFNGSGSGLTSLNASQISSGTLADARIDSALARDSEVLSATNSLNASLLSAIDATNSALMSKITTTSNALDSSISTVDSTLSALDTRLQSGNSTFAGSNHFSGITVLTNTANVIAGDGAALMSLNADNIASGTVSRSRLPSDLVYDEPEGGITLSGSVTAPSFNGSGSGLTSLNASQISSGTLADARIDSALARDSEVNIVSNALSLRLIGTNTALMSNVTTTSNALDTAIGNEATARAALQTQLQTGDNAFAGSNHFSGIVFATNNANVFNGNGSGLGGLWRTGGNSGTTAADFIGTSDAQPLEIRLDNKQVMRFEGSSGVEPNLLGGIPDNAIDSEVKGSVIVGGGILEDTMLEQPLEANYIRSGSDHSFIGGGYNNQILTNSSESFIGGGHGHTINNDSVRAAILGGRSHTISTNSDYSIIGGGDFNRIFEGAHAAAILSGTSQQISTNGDRSVIAGGGQNLIGTNATYATIPGGRNNRAAGDYSFAAGRQAKADHDGAFVWADSQAANFTSTRANEFRVRANGGMVFNAGSADIEFTTTGDLTYNGFPMGGQPASDRDVKKNFTELDSREVLEKLAAMPITRWNYKKESDGHWKHIGPMVQDFNPAFFPERKDKFISTLEYGGVSLAAIKGLNEKLEDKLEQKDKEIANLRQELDALKEIVMAMQQSADTR